MYIKQFIIVFSSCLLLSCATTGSDRSAADSGSSNCIYGSSVRGYVVLDESNLIVEASGRRKYHMGLKRRAFGIRTSRGISFDSPTSSICSYSDLLFEGQFARESVPVGFIREIGADEEQELLIRFGKKEPEMITPPAPAEVPGAEVEELDTGAKVDTTRD